MTGAQNLWWYGFLRCPLVCDYSSCWFLFSEWYFSRVKDLEHANFAQLYFMDESWRSLLSASRDFEELHRSAPRLYWWWLPFCVWAETSWCSQVFWDSCRVVLPAWLTLGWSNDRIYSLCSVELACKCWPLKTDMYNFFFVNKILTFYGG